MAVRRYLRLALSNANVEHNGYESGGCGHKSGILETATGSQIAVSGKDISMAEKLRVTLVKSMIGRPEKHRKVLRGMGLTKLNKTVELLDTPPNRGMISKVSHLVKAEEIT